MIIEQEGGQVPKGHLLGDMFALNWKLLAQPWVALLDLYFPL